jgi:hypothetical protein
MRVLFLKSGLAGGAIVDPFVSLSEPTAAQARAGNYSMAHLDIGGLKVSIETPKGATRRGVGRDGVPWEVTMPAHYGYIRGTEGADGDHFDVTIGPWARIAAELPVWVVDQIDPEKSLFDEHKGFVGFGTMESALEAYDGSFSDGSGPRRRGAVTGMSFADFKAWSETEDAKKPLAWKAKAGPMVFVRPG